MHALQAQFAALPTAEGGDAVTADDDLLPHGLGTVHLRAFAETLARFEKIGCACGWSASNCRTPPAAALCRAGTWRGRAQRSAGLDASYA